VIVALAAAFALLAALVVSGSLTSLDQYAIDHLMPALKPSAASKSGNPYVGLYSPFSSGTNWWCTIFALWTYPCSVLVSGLVMVSVVSASLRRSRPLPALALAGAWVVGNAVELAGKGLLRRPGLYLTHDGVRSHVVAFDNSFPSGHTIRGALVAAALALLWPAGRRWLIGWFALVGPFLVLSSAHTPSDVLGGLLVVAALLGGARLLAASPSFAGLGSRLPGRVVRKAPGAPKPAAASPPPQRVSR